MAYLLVMAMSLQSVGVFANETNNDEQLSPGEMFMLARQLEEDGYQRSALHYYQMILQNPKSSKKIINVSRTNLERIELALADKKKGMKQLSDFPNFQVAREKNTVANVQESDFPRTHVNRTKWFISTVVLMSVSYYVYKQMTKEDPPPVPVLSVEIRVQ